MSQNMIPSFSPQDKEEVGLQEPVVVDKLDLRVESDFENGNGINILRNPGRREMIEIGEGKFGLEEFATTIYNCKPSEKEGEKDLYVGKYQSYDKNGNVKAIREIFVRSKQIENINVALNEDRYYHSMDLKSVGVDDLEKYFRLYENTGAEPMIYLSRESFRIDRFKEAIAAIEDGYIQRNPNSPDIQPIPFKYDSNEVDNYGRKLPPKYIQMTYGQMKKLKQTIEEKNL